MTEIYEQITGTLNVNFNKLIVEWYMEIWNRNRWEV